jgi:hypothetical protein
MATLISAPKKHVSSSVKPPADLNKGARSKVTTKTADNKGRIGLGGVFANRSVIIEQLSKTELIVKLARVIPESEAWLYDNAKALTAVRNGLAQARAGQLTDGPDVEADADFAAQLED